MCIRVCVEGGEEMITSVNLQITMEMVTVQKYASLYRVKLGLWITNTSLNRAASQEISSVLMINDK